ncbi:trithorax group protein osa-like isoform X2 [Varroa destructor]|nr:trithorax group protein osa-like isoform X2 [Varroa destructor]
MTRRSFVAGCQVATLQQSEGVPKTTSKLLSLQAGEKDSAQGSSQSNGSSNTNSISKDSNGGTTAASGRRIGSGRLDRAFKDTRSDRDRDYGYGTNDRDRDRDRDQGRRRGTFDFRKDSKGSDMRSRRYDLAPREDEPEWFTEGPTSQTDTIELGGFEDARTGSSRDGASNNNPSDCGEPQGSGREKKQMNAHNRSQMTPSPDPERHKKSWSEKELLRELASTGSNSGPKRETPSPSQDDDNDKPLHSEAFEASQERQGASISFENFFLNSGEQTHAELPDEQRPSSAMLGSRFMSKVFSKAPMPSPERGESPRNPSPDHNQHEQSEQSRPVMEMLRAATIQEVPPPGGVDPSPGGPPAFLRELMQMPLHLQGGGGDISQAPPHMNMMSNQQHHQNNNVGGIMSMGASHGPPGPLEALLAGPPGQHHHHHHHHNHNHHGVPLHPGQPHMHSPHGMPPIPGPPMEHINSNDDHIPNNKSNCDNGPAITSGRELLDLLLLGASAKGAPSPPPPPPQHAKTVEQLEAEFKMQASRPMMHPSVHHHQHQQQQQQQQHQQQGHLNHGPRGGPTMSMHGGIPHHPPPIDRPLNGLMPLGEVGHHNPMSMGAMGHHFPPGPPHMRLHHPPQQQNHGLNAGQDILRLLTEGANRGDVGHGRGIDTALVKPAFKQDLKNVPTQVLLREKDLVIQRESNGSAHCGPRPIVKSNKSNTPPGPPPPAMPTPQPHENGAEFLSKFLQQHQQQQQQQQQQQPSQQHQQPSQARQAPCRPPHGGGPYLGGNTSNGPTQHAQNNSNSTHQGNGGNPKMIRGGNPPPIQSTHQSQPSTVLEELFASAGQGGQQDRRLILGPSNGPRPLTGMHGQRYGEITHYVPPQHMQVPQPMKSQSNSNSVQSHNPSPFAKWFGEGLPAGENPALPRNVVRVEDLERQQQRFH